jgi:hypothetical protein
MSTWGSQSWDSVDDYGASATTTATNDGPRTFFMPAGVTKRIIMLDGAPFTFWQHSLYEITRNAKDKEVCLKKNRIGHECPICDKELWASMIGYFSVIDMGDVKRGAGGKVTLEGWTSEKGVVYQFGKKLLGAKRGGKDKPGILKKIARLAERHGDLTGCVFDVYRSGGKVESCGDEWDFVEKIAPDQIGAYLLANGADEAHIADLKPYNYSEVFVPKSVEELKALIGGGAGVASPTAWSGAAPASSGSGDWNKWG